MTLTRQRLLHAWTWLFCALALSPFSHHPAPFSAQDRTNSQSGLQTTLPGSIKTQINTTKCVKVHMQKVANARNQLYALVMMSYEDCLASKTTNEEQQRCKVSAGISCVTESMFEKRAYFVIHVAFTAGSLLIYDKTRSGSEYGHLHHCFQKILSV